MFRLLRSLCWLHFFSASVGAYLESVLLAHPSERTLRSTESAAGGCLVVGMGLLLSGVFFRRRWSVSLRLAALTSLALFTLPLRLSLGVTALFLIAITAWEDRCGRNRASKIPFFSSLLTMCSVAFALRSQNSGSSWPLAALASMILLPGWLRASRPAFGAGLILCLVLGWHGENADELMCAHAFGWLGAFGWFTADPNVFKKPKEVPLRSVF